MYVYIGVEISLTCPIFDNVIVGWLCAKISTTISYKQTNIPHHITATKQQQQQYKIRFSDANCIIFYYMFLLLYYVVGSILYILGKIVYLKYFLFMKK